MLLLCVLSTCEAKLLEFAIPTHTRTCAHTHTCPLHPLSSEDRLTAAVGASADSLLSFSTDRDPLRVDWWPEWGVGGACGEITRPRCAAPMDDDSSLSTGKGFIGRWSAVACPAPLGSCLLAEDTPFLPLPPGGVPTAGVPGPTSGVVPPTDSPLAYIVTMETEVRRELHVTLTGVAPSR